MQSIARMRSADQGDQVGEGHVGPPAVIMAQEEEDQEFDRHDPGQPGPELAPRRGGGHREVEIAAGRPARRARAKTARCAHRHAQNRGAASRWACWCSRRPQPRRQRRGGGAGGLGRRIVPAACGVPAFDRLREQSASSVSRSMAGGNHLPALSGLSPALDWSSHCLNPLRPIPGCGPWNE